MTAQTMIYWLRKTHGWIGLWGAVLGLLFGFSGIWLNHRSVLKLPPVFQEKSHVQLALPEPAPENAQAMAQWLQSSLQIKGEANTVKVDASRPVAWSETKELKQPERWSFTFGSPSTMIQAEYWRGNRSLSVNTTANGFIGTLTNLHKGSGMSVAWILLVDTLAGSMIFLSLSGIALWLLTQRRRTVGITIATASTALVLTLIALRLGY